MSNVIPKKLLYLHNGRVDSREANLVQVVSMCNAFSRFGYRVTLVLNARSMSDAEAERKLQSAFSMDHTVRVKLIRQRLHRKLAKHLSCLQIPSIIRSESPDVIFVRDPRYFRMSLRSAKPVLLEIHNTHMHLGNRWLNAIFCRWILTGAGKKGCEKVICISEALRDYWVSNGIPEEKTMVLHDGFSTELFTEVIPLPIARSTLGIDPEATLVVYSGNLQANRGIHYILDLSVAFPHVLFLLVGGNPERRILYEEVCRNRGIVNIRFEGQQPHNRIPLYLYAADVLLAMWSREVPTINFCSPLKVFEYLATGIPMVIPGYPTIMEVVEDGKDAFVCLPDDPLSFEKTLQRALDADSESLRMMASNARKKATESYSWNTRAQRIILAIPEKLRP
ncbi:MAG TPA: glycosyltransferase [Bacteroidales bacterium]|nr:glycosyltransferase [Bacteroidales bacterium]HRZ49948.1 glycosyltransferase [Bacteroidales bacterium]